jgi:hypothetical protein
MSRFVVTIGPVDHDGARYEDGDLIPVTDDAAAALVAAGAIEAVKAAGKDPKPPANDKPSAGD